LFVSLAEYNFVQMFMIARGLGFASAFVVAVLCFGVPVARAQSVPYWTTTAGFGSGLASDPNANVYGNFASRYNFDNGWFVGSERGNLGLGMGLGNFSQPGAFGNGASFTYEGAQAGYNFKSAPVSVYAGFDTLKYNAPPIIGSPFAALDSMSSSTSPGYGVHAGVEIRPTSNLSLSFGASFSQQPSDLNSALLPGASPLAFGHR
jgi:opacity protein-like surface antigen